MSTTHFDTNLTPSLAGAHLRTREKIFRHPAAHNLDWREVRALFERLGQVDEEPNGNLKVTINGHSQIFPAPRTKEVQELDELMKLRHFLERAESIAAATVPGGEHWLVFIDHHEARLYRSERHGAKPEQILPHEPEDFFRHAPNSKEFSRGQEKPDPNSFFEPVAKALQGAAKILLMGNGKGTSSEMEQFAAWLTRHHPELAARVIGSMAVDQHHLTEAQLLAKAREFYAAVAPVGK
jgi:hypothetical protein